MPNFAREQDFAVLHEVVTLAEAARLVNKPYNTVIYAIDAGNVAALKCGRIWLVSRQSLMAWFFRS